MEQKKEIAGATPARVESTDKRNITDSVLARINSFMTTGELSLHANYSAENALKSAWLILQETVDRNGKPVLEICTQGSIANALFDMVVQGLSPLKKQCYFIAREGKLYMDRSYMGTMAVAKRDGGIKGITANCVYEGDVFEYNIDVETGLRRIVKHEQSLNNLDKAVVGAYAILDLGDGVRHVEIMNKVQIGIAWNQGPMKGNSPAHNKFPDEMAKRTVINRACKPFINSSDDSNLEENDPIVATKEAAIKLNGNSAPLSIEPEAKNLSISEAVEVKEEQPEKEVQKNGKQKEMGF